MVFETIAYTVPPPRRNTNRTARQGSVERLSPLPPSNRCSMIVLRGGGGLGFMIDPSVCDPWADYECVAAPPDVVRCGDPRYLGATYVHLLGLYLGDGCISRAPKSIWKLRIFQDRRYPGLIEECVKTIESVCGKPPGRMPGSGCVELYSNWKHWTCLLPQHGPRRKHERPIVLREWQNQLVRAHPWEMVRGLIQSDGCRSINRVRRPSRKGVREYPYVRYFFTNASPDIRALFTETCSLVGVDCRRMTERDISIARKESVELLEQFVGPKS